jgi:hypothetical protein
MAKTPVWLCGNWAAPGLDAPLDWLNARANCLQVDPTRSTSVLACVEPPAAAVVAQARPGDFAADDLERLQTALSDAPVLLLAGPWCEGELRSGTPLLQIVRIPWRRWRGGLEADLKPLLAPAEANQRAAYTLPADAQLIARNLRAVKENKPAFGTAAICTESLPLYESLADALEKLRTKATRANSSSADSLASVKLVIYDGWPAHERFRSVRQPAASMRELLLLDWPRPADAQRAAQAGIHGILAVPFLLSDLATTLSNL